MVNKENDTIEENSERCLQVMDFILNYRQDQDAMNVKKKEKDNKFRKQSLKFDKLGANRKVLSLTNHNTFENESLTASRPITGS